MKPGKDAAQATGSGQAHVEEEKTADEENSDDDFELAEYEIENDLENINSAGEGEED